MIKEILWNQWAIEGYNINDSLILRDINNSKYQFKSLINETKLILRFSDMSCEDCQIQEIKLVTDLLRHKNILVIASFESIHTFKSYVKSHQIKIPIYLVDSNVSIFKNRNKPINQVYSFIIDNNGISKHIHFAKFAFPEFSKSYYELIGYKYKINQQSDD